MKQYWKAGQIVERPKSLVFNGITYIPPTDEILIEAGYEMATPSEVLASGNIFENDYVDNIENGVIYLIKDKNIDFWKGHNYAYISSLLKKYDENPEGYNEFEFFNNIKQAVNIKRKTLIILKERY